MVVTLFEGISDYIRESCPNHISPNHQTIPKAGHWPHAENPVAFLRVANFWDLIPLLRARKNYFCASINKFLQVTRKDVDASYCIDKAELTPKIDSVLTSYRKRADIPGFRKGNVPMGLIKKQYGAAVKADETNKMLQESLTNYISKEKIALLGNPLPVERDDFDWDAETMLFDFELGLSPSFEVKLKGVITCYEITADGETIKQIDRMRSQ